MEVVERRTLEHLGGENYPRGRDRSRMRRALAAAVDGRDDANQISIGDNRHSPGIDWRWLRPTEAMVVVRALSGRADRCD
jgi:hypothetical protein